MARVPGWWKSRKGAISGAMRFVRAASPGPHWLPRWPPPIGHRTACVRCGGKLGPDITGRPICYGCGPSKMMPAGKLRDAAMEREQCDAQDPKGLAR